MAIRSESISEQGDALGCFMATLAIQLDIHNRHEHLSIYALIIQKAVQISSDAEDIARFR